MHHASVHMVDSKAVCDLPSAGHRWKICKDVLLGLCDYQAYVVTRQGMVFCGIRLSTTAISSQSEAS